MWSYCEPFRCFALSNTSFLCSSSRSLARHNPGLFGILTTFVRVTLVPIIVAVMSLNSVTTPAGEVEARPLMTRELRRFSRNIKRIKTNNARFYGNYASFSILKNLFSQEFHSYIHKKAPESAGANIGDNRRQCHRCNALSMEIPLQFSSDHPRFLVSSDDRCLRNTTNGSAGD